jgi:hypothetical protein
MKFLMMLLMMWKMVAHVSAPGEEDDDLHQTRSDDTIQIYRE